MNQADVEVPFEKPRVTFRAGRAHSESVLIGWAGANVPEFPDVLRRKAKGGGLFGAESSAPSAQQGKADFHAGSRVVKRSREPELESAQALPPVGIPALTPEGLLNEDRLLRKAS
jgi:hypothetical protein